MNRKFWGLKLGVFLVLAQAALPSCALRVSSGTEVRLRVTLGDREAAGVTLSDARLSLDEITLVPCVGEPEARRWSLGAVAHAHHGSADGRSRLESQVRLGETAELGALTPPSGRYCSVEVIVAPGRVEPMLNQSVTADLAVPPMRLAAAGNRLLEVPIEPLELNAATPRAELTLEIDLARALSELDLNLPSDDVALDLLVALPDHVRALVVFDPPA